MLALVFTAPGVMELQEVEEPRPDDESVVLHVRAAGICGSELHGFRSPGVRRPPLVMGHEVAGTTPDGRRVVVNPLLSCGGCDLCRSGLPQVCRRRELLGVQRPGGFAQRVSVPARALYDMPPEMPWEAAVMVEPIANAVHAWRPVSVTGGERVAIIGAGPIGLVCLLWALRMGVTNVTVVDRSPHRLALATRLGASTCAATLDDEQDVVLDAVGAAVTRRSAVARVRPGGTTVWLGLAEADAGFEGNDLVRSEKRVVGSFAYTPQDFAEALAGAPELDLSWTSPVTLEESQRTFMALANGASDPVKAVIRP